MDWRGAAWLAPVAARNEQQAALHEAALAALDEHEATGKPFVLFLRTFRIRQLYGHGLDANGARTDESTAMVLEEHLFEQLSRRGASVIKVRDQSDVGDVTAKLWEHRAPALLLDDAGWLAGVKALMRSAEMIVSECQVLGPGVLAELKACEELGKADRTVLVLPSPPFEFVGNEADVQSFARTVHQHELDQDCPVRSVVFRDLVTRLQRIARLEPARRLELIRAGTLDQAVPVTYRGVVPGLTRLAREYASKKNVGATFFVGSRAVRAAEATHGPAGAVRQLLALAELCDRAGNTELATTVVDDAWKAVADSQGRLDEAATRRFRAAIERLRQRFLGKLFESLMNQGEIAQLWRLANSQAGYALGRQEDRVVSQGFGWMAVAALQAGQFEQAMDHAQDAILFAQKARDRYREGFASVYLGHAQRRLGQDREAAMSYARALELLPVSRIDRIHTVAMLGMAQTTERLGQPEKALVLYRSSLEMARGLRLADLAAAAQDGVARLSPPGDGARPGPPGKTD